MRSAIRLSVLVLAIASCALAQRQSSYTAVRKATLSGAAEVLTLRVPTGSAKTARLSAASIYASVATELTLERDGTYASGSAITPAKLNPELDATAVSLPTYGTSISGTTVIGQYTVPAGGTLVLDLYGVEVRATKSITIRTASVTGTVIITLKWYE